MDVSHSARTLAAFGGHFVTREFGARFAREFNSRDRLLYGIAALTPRNRRAAKLVLKAYAFAILVARKRVSAIGSPEASRTRFEVWVTNVTTHVYSSSSRYR